MLTIVHKSTFASDYGLYEGRDHVADITLSRLRNAGEFDVDGTHYVFGPAPGWSWTSAPLILESDPPGVQSSRERAGSRQLVASAKCPGVFLRAGRPRAVLSYRGWECEFWQGRNVGTWIIPSHEIDLRSRGVVLGSWTRDLEFRQEAAPPRDLPLAVKVFMAAWVLLDRRGESTF